MASLNLSLSPTDSLNRYLASDLFDWMAEATNRDPTDYNYRRTELRLSPYVWWKTLFFQTIPVGNKFMGTHTLERLERVRELLLAFFGLLLVQQT